MTTSRFYFRQLLSGRDFAKEDPMAAQMANFVYLIGDRETRNAVIVDPAYGVSDILDILDQDGMQLSGVLASHYHPDHVGGSMMGFELEGIAALLNRVDVPIHIQADEADFVRKVTGVTDESLVQHASGDIVRVGDVEIELIHTPGHTPGSMSFSVDGAPLLFSGDTLFPGGPGATQYEGGDFDTIMQSLEERMFRVFDGDTLVLPGHGLDTTLATEAPHLDEWYARGW